MYQGLWFALFLTGCASGIQRTLHTPNDPLTITGVVMYSPHVSGEALPAWRAYELGERLVTAAVAAFGERLAFFGPTEVNVVRWEDDAAWVGSNAVAVLLRSGIRPEQALVLRPAIEKRVTGQLRESSDPRGRKRGWLTEETTWVARVEILHPSSGLELAELSGQVTVDPFAEPNGEEEFDPAPAMTHLLEQIVTEALSSVSSFFVHRPPPPPTQVALAQTPAQAASLPDPAVARLDPLAAELWLQNRARFLTPTLSEREILMVAKARPGLWVLVAPRGASVRRGDVVIEVDGEPPLRQVLARRRLQGTPVPVRIDRGTVEIDAVIP